MSVSYAFVQAGFPVVDLPRCQCGGDYVDFVVDVGVSGDRVILVGHTSCGDCDLEPPFLDPGSDCLTWRDAVLRCVNAWSVSHGGIFYPAFASLPDQLDGLVDFVELRLGPLPEYRAKVMAKHIARRLV